MSHPLKELLDAWARRLNDSGIPYGVIHGLEGYPDRIGRDIDVLVGEDHLENIHAITVALAKELDYQAAHRDHPYGRSIYLTHDYRWDDTVEIHLLFRLEWVWADLASVVNATEAIGPFKVDAWAAWVKTCLHPLLVNDSRTRPIYPCPPQLFWRGAARCLGTNAAKWFGDMPEEYSPRLLKGQRRTLQAAVLLQQLKRSPRQAATCWRRFVMRKIHANSGRILVPIVLLGPSSQMESARRPRPVEPMPIFTDEEWLETVCSLRFDQSTGSWRFESGQVEAYLRRVPPRVTLLVIPALQPVGTDETQAMAPVILPHAWSGPPPTIMRYGGNECGDRYACTTADKSVLLNGELSTEELARRIHQTALKALLGWLNDR